MGSYIDWWLCEMVTTEPGIHLAELQHRLALSDNRLNRKTIGRRLRMLGFKVVTLQS